MAADDQGGPGAAGAADQATLGGARSKGVSYDQLLDLETRPVPPSLRRRSEPFLGSDGVPKEVFYSHEFMQLEIEKVWKRVWQFACREEDVPRVGDSFVYDIADLSLLLVRTAPDQIRAFHNQCLHRGRQLRTHNGRLSQIRCPFHGLTWNLDGTFKAIPSCAWDFPHLEISKMSLPEARVGTWGGFIFLCLDPDGPTLEEYLGEFPEVWGPWPLDQYYKTAHTSQLVRANWKTTIEAFMESLHVQATHPQIAEFTGDGNAQIDVWADAHFSRMITPFGLGSPELPAPVPEERVLSHFVASRNEPLLGGAAEQQLKLEDGVTARERLVALMRPGVREIWGEAEARMLDTEILDNHQYWLFPNFEPHLSGPGRAMVYHVRPYGLDPDMCVFDVIVLQRLPEGAERPPPAKAQILGPDDQPGFLEQDWTNLKWVQRGLHALQRPRINLGLYTESRIRHLHQVLDRYISA